MHTRVCVPERYRPVAALILTLGVVAPAVAAVSPEAAALDVINGCLAAANGTEALECPELAPALAATPLPSLLTSDVTKPVTPSELRDLASFLRAYGRAGTAAAAPDPAAVPAVLAALPSRPETRPSAWQRFLAWLEQWLASKDEAAIELDWLTSIDLPNWLPRALYYTLLALLAGFSAGFVIMELRAARAPGRRTRIPSSRHTADTQGQPTLANITRLEAAHQPGALLRFVIHTLGEQKRLTDDASLTNRELHRDLMARDPAFAEQFGDFAAAIERLSYGGEDRQHSLPPLIAAAQALVAEYHDSQGPP